MSVALLSTITALDSYMPQFSAHILKSEQFYGFHVDTTRVLASYPEVSDAVREAVQLSLTGNLRGAVSALERLEDMYDISVTCIESLY